MSLHTKPKTYIMTGNAGISETLKRQGYVKTLCFAVDPIADERALDAIREGICDIHVTAEQLQDLREKVAVILLMAVFAILDGAGRNIARLINKCGGKL